MKYYILITSIILIFPFAMGAMTSEERERVGDMTAAVETAEVHQKSCLICFEPKNEDEVYKLSCGHTFCRECLTRTIDIAIGERAFVQLRCPDQTCKQSLSRVDIINITRNPATLTTIDDIQTLEWIAQQPNAKHCPTPDCSYIFLNDERCPQPIECPSCAHKYCSNCLFPHAVRMTCREAEAGRAIDRESDAWKLANTKPCPRCGTRIEKDGGCDWVQCTHCRLGFCYNCGGDHHALGCTRPPMVIEKVEEGSAEANPYEYERLAMFECDRLHHELADRQALNLERNRARRLRQPEDDHRLFEPGDIHYRLDYPGVVWAARPPIQARERLEGLRIVGIAGPAAPVIRVPEMVAPVPVREIPFQEERGAIVHHLPIEEHSEPRAEANAYIEKVEDFTSPATFCNWCMTYNCEKHRNIRICIHIPHHIFVEFISFLNKLIFKQRRCASLEYRKHPSCDRVVYTTTMPLIKIQELLAQVNHHFFDN